MRILNLSARKDNHIQLLPPPTNTLKQEILLAVADSMLRNLIKVRMLQPLYFSMVGLIQKNEFVEYAQLVLIILFFGVRY